jgi:hypothetical protein
VRQGGGGVGQGEGVHGRGGADCVLIIGKFTGWSVNTRKQGGLLRTAQAPRLQA